MEQIDRLLAQGKTHEAADLIRKSVAEGRKLDGDPVRYANQLVIDCDWETVAKLLPPEMNALETSGWLHSLRTGRPVDRNGSALPWMNYAAIDFIGAKITAQTRVFEWGAGYSSLWFAARAMEVVCAEDNIEWNSALGKKLPANVRLMSLPGKADYVNCITNEPGEFDVIVIDGSFRNDCAPMCDGKLAKNGFVIFDNSDSREFDQSMKYFGEQGYFRIDFWGLIPSYLYKNCTSIFFRDADILKHSPPPSKMVPSTGISCFQAYFSRVAEDS